MAKYEPIHHAKSDDSDLQQASPNQDALDGEKPTHLWTSARVVGIILFYCAIGSSLSVLNKVAVTYIPAPNFILFCQFFATAVMLIIAHSLKLVEVEPLTKEIAIMRSSR